MASNQNETMVEYHDLYLTSDVLLLADVFENFSQRLDLIIIIYLLFFTVLYRTEINLQWLNDIDMIHMIQKGIRGGVSIITQKYAKAKQPAGTWIW